MNFIESIRITNCSPEHLDLHSRRIVRTIGTPIALCPDLPPELVGSVVKWRVEYNARGIVSQEYLPYRIPQIKTLRTVVADDLDYSFKYADRSAISALFATRGECDDILIVKNGNVTDSSFCNVVFERDGICYTPAEPLLEGVRRASLLRSGRIVPRQISCAEIGNFDRIYLINAMIDLGEVVIDLRRVLP